MSQGRSKSSHEIFERVRVNAAVVLVFRDFGWVFGTLNLRTNIREIMTSQNYVAFESKLLLAVLLLLRIYSPKLPLPLPS